MNNRLQFRHHGIGSGYTADDGVFETRESAIWYATHDIRDYDDGINPDGVDNSLSLYSEPTILRYKNVDDEDDPHVLLLIGSMTNTSRICSNNKFCIIDPHKTESEIEDIQEELEKAIRSLTLVVNDSDTLALSVNKTEDGTLLSGDVIVAEGHVFSGETQYKTNKILPTEDGIFMFVDMDYDSENDVIKFTVNNIEKDLTLDLNYVTEGIYNEVDESIHLKMKHGEDVVINLEHLIGEWVVEGEAANSPIILKREEVGYGTDAHVHVEPWQDILSADVRIANDRVNNILEKTSDNRYLYVDGVASNIAYYKNGEKTNVKDVLDALTKIKLSNDSSNMLIEKVDGFFASSKLEYISNENTLVFTVSSNEDSSKKKETRIKLNTFKLFERIDYDPTKEALVITYIDGNGQLQFVEIPLGELIADWEWDVNNYGHNIELQKERMVQGPDQLSADVVLSEESDNILEDVNHTLYVKGTSDNIKHGDDSTVKDEINNIKAFDENIADALDDEIQRSIAEEERLQGEIDAVSADTAIRLKSVVNNDHSINVDNTDAINPVIKVNLSTEVEDGNSNIIKLNNDGLFATVDLEYYFDSGSSKNVLIFKTTNGTKTFDLKTNSVVDNIYYDATTEEIVIEYTVNGKRMPDVRIPVRDMIDEIDVQSTSSVELIKTKDTSAGADIIKANVIINGVHDDNILVNDGGLYVSGSQITENKNAINALTNRMTVAEANIDANADAISDEAARATSAENELNRVLSEEIARSTSKDTELENAIESETSRAQTRENAIASDLSSEIQRATASENAISSALSNEVVRATSAETALQTALNTEISNRTVADNNISHNLSDEVARATAAEEVNATAIANETTRATAAETANASAIANEITRATVAETANADAIAAEEARATSEEARIEEKVDTLADDTTYVVVNTNSVTLTKSDEARGTSIKADVNVSSNSGNIIKIETDGIFADVDLSYDATSNKLTFETTNGSKEIALVSNSLVERVYYNAAEEKIVIVYKVNGQEMPDVEIPVRDIINEIAVESTSSVELTKTVDTSAGADIIKANVKINSVHSDNILVNDGGLYVSGAQIEENKSDIAELKVKATALSGAIDSVASNLATETSRATAAEQANASAIANEIDRATIKETEIASNLETEVTRATAAEQANATAIANEISRSTEKDNELQTALTQEVNDRTAAVLAETTRATSAETALQTALTSEISRATNAEVANANAIAAEETRAKAAEQANATAIANEVSRATAAEEALDAKIDAKTFEVTSEDSATLDLTVTDGNKISGNVLVANSNDNIIKAASDSSVGTGLYASVDITYDAATNKLKLITSALEKEIALNIGSIIKSIEYDPVGKNLIIKYETNTAGHIIEQTIMVPVDDLFNDWTVQEGQHLGAIILHKTNGVSGNPDILSAEVVLSTLSDNMLINDQGALYVSRQPITHIEEEIEDIKAQLHDDIHPQETATLRLQLDSAYNLSGSVKLSNNSLNLIRVDGDNGLIYDGSVDLGEY